MAKKNEKKKEEPIKRAVTSAEWMEITGLYLKGVNLKEICDKYPKTNITRDKIRAKMKRDGITWRKEHIETEVKDRICQEMIDDKLETIRRIVKLYNNALDVADDILQGYKNEAMLNPTKPRATAYNLDQLSGALNKCHNGLKMALGIEDKSPEDQDTAPKIITIKGIEMEDI